MDPWQECLKLDKVTDKLVENGVSFERALFDLTRYRAVVLPHDAVVRRGTVNEGFNIYLEKIQDYKGVPAGLVSIRENRKLMGVACRPSGQMVAFATYGDWTTSEGGGKVRMTVLIPPDVEVKQREDLSGSVGMANNHTPGTLSPGPGYPKAGWTGLACEPNPTQFRI